jgi:hypothetical protein
MVYYRRFELDHDLKRFCLAYDPGIWFILLWNGRGKVRRIPSTLVRCYGLDNHISGTYPLFYASLIVVVLLGIFTHVFPNSVTIYRRPCKLRSQGGTRRT